jgi:hypothetical protein
MLMLRGDGKWRESGVNEAPEREPFDLESCLPLGSNVASDQPDEDVQRVGGSHLGNPGLEFRKGGCQGARISDEGSARHSGVC